MSDIIKFTTPQHRHLKDYGYDLKARQVISFKNTINGHQLLRRTTYNINGAQISHTAIHNSAVAESGLQKQTGLVSTKQKQSGVDEQNCVLGAANKQKVCVTSLGSTEEFIAFSRQHKVSQYFRAGTSLMEVLEKFKNRGFDIDPVELSILDPVTGKINHLQPEISITYTLV